MTSLPVIKKELNTPSLEEVAKVLEDGLQKNFDNATCEVVECPDLSEAPWGLAAQGICGSCRIGELGGVKFLAPLPKLEKIYDFKNLTKSIELPNAFVIGAGAGPYPYVGKNSEMIANIKTGNSFQNETRIAKLNDEDEDCILEKVPLDETRCCILLNFFACDGNKGPVIRVRATKRTGEDDFVGCMRKALDKKYESKVVGMGGTFMMKTGTAKIHVMPGFSEKPLESEDALDDWLKYIYMKGPMVFMSVFASRDPGLDFRVEHTHGYGKDEGGHYHYDVTPDEVEYEGYFNVADFMYRVDKP